MGLDLPIDWLSLLMFGGLALLLMLGLPMAFCTGSLAVHLPVRVRHAADAEHAAVARLPVHDRLPALGRPAVHLHGGDPGEGRHHRGAVRRRLQMAGRAEGRPRVGDGGRVHDARGDGRRGRRHRGDDGHDRPAGHAAARLRRQARLRRAARRRHARHPDPALGHGDRLCRGRAAVAGRAAGRRRSSRASCCRACTSPTSRSAATSIRASARRCRSRSASTSARSSACCATRSRRSC